MAQGLSGAHGLSILEQMVDGSVWKTPFALFIWKNINTERLSDQSEWKSFYTTAQFSSLQLYYKAYHF